ncbi:hypothetical protein PENDEC_c001G02555 [Penicillium decumbens]|uniref:Uncharacterized protein n=1 Tax=Penicillium decumbens TaxID=69771 RepID=A0A1V6PNB5_PENDC|nr:hypothetical protein PENDEC_c001G02555 [Penicillium decumbens]
MSSPRRQETASYTSSRTRSPFTAVKEFNRAFARAFSETEATLLAASTEQPQIVDLALEPQLAVQPSIPQPTRGKVLVSKKGKKVCRGSSSPQANVGTLRSQKPTGQEAGPAKIHNVISIAHLEPAPQEVRDDGSEEAEATLDPRFPEQQNRFDVDTILDKKIGLLGRSKKPTPYYLVR